MCERMIVCGGGGGGGGVCVWWWWWWWCVCVCVFVCVCVVFVWIFSQNTGTDGHPNYLVTNFVMSHGESVRSS